MSATEELIAAALRLAALAERNTDDRDEWQHAIDSVRELCPETHTQPQSVELPEPDAVLCDDGYFVAAPHIRTSHEYNRAGWRLDVISISSARTYGDAREAAGYARGRAEQQAVIDRLMMEHCPDEMTAEQRQTWAAAQAEKGGE